MIRLSLIALTLLLGACQTRLPVGPLPDSVDHLQNWNLSGRLGYRAGNDGGSASIDWRQRHPEGEIHFSGPVGIGSARLFWAPGSAELAWRLTGLWLPVEALQFWVRGLPWPDAPGEEQRNELGQLVALKQLGWSLTFSDYLSSGALTLPQRIRASHDDQRFTLVIRKWEPLP